jgi:membrane associated rhomboid family serine protease
VRIPPVTLTLIVANCAVYLLQLSGGTAIEDWFALWPPGSDGSMARPPFQFWQLVTYAFLHDPRTIAHIFFNMFALYMFGSDVERLFGGRFYLYYYFASVVSAAICHLLYTSWVGGPGLPTVGASGGIYGILLAYAIYFPNRRVILLIFPYPMPARVFVTLFAALELVLGVSQTASGIAHFAHLGGMLGGFLMIQYRRGRFPFSRWR